MAEPHTMTILLVILAILTSAFVIVNYSLIRNVIAYARLLKIKKMIAYKLSNEEEIFEKKHTSLFHKKLEEFLVKYMLLSGVNLSLWQIAFLLAVITSIFGILFALFLKHWSGWIIGFGLGIGLIYMVANAKALHRKREFNSAFANTISLLVKMMRNGIGFEQALYKSVMNSNSKLFKSHFEQFFLEKNTIGEEEAFVNLNKRVDSKELRIFTMAVKIGRQSGGQFSVTLEKVEQTLRYRKKMQDKINVITREGTVGTYMVASINVVLYFMIDMNFNGKVTEYFLTSEWGRWQLMGISIWMLLGLIVNRFITRINL